MSLDHIPAAPKELQVINGDMITSSILELRREKALRELPDNSDKKVEINEEINLHNEVELLLSYKSIEILYYISP